MAGEPSIYETLRQDEESSDHSDLEERAGMALDEENLGTAFQDHELDDVLADAATTLPSPFRAGSASRGKVRHKPQNSEGRLRTPGVKSVGVPEEHDDDVPSSLLFEGNQEVDVGFQNNGQSGLPPPMQGPPSRGSRAKWKATQEQQKLYENPRDQKVRGGHPVHQLPSKANVNPSEQAMWRWANVQNLDNFLNDVYEYFLGNGIWCILLGRGLNLL